MNIALGADHGGVDLKHAIVTHLQSTGHTVKDFGTNSTDSVDYADYADEVSRGVVSGLFDRGILICRSGIGMCLTANRFQSVRAANVRTVDETITTRAVSYTHLTLPTTPYV